MAYGQNENQLTEIPLITPTSFHTNKTKHQNKVKYFSFEATALKLIFRYYNTLAAGLHQVT